MPASLAEQLAQAWLSAQRMDLVLDWPNLPSEERAVWEAVAAVARDLCQSAVVGFRCQCGVDHYFETREQVAAERDQIRRDYLDVADALLPRSEGPADLVAEARRLRAEVERLTRERDELLAYIDAAKLAAGDRRVSGEPLSAFVERLIVESDQEAWK